MIVKFYSIPNVRIPIKGTDEQKQKQYKARQAEIDALTTTGGPFAGALAFAKLVSGPFQWIEELKTAPPEEGDGAKFWRARDAKGGDKAIVRLARKKDGSYAKIDLYSTKANEGFSDPSFSIYSQETANFYRSFQKTFRYIPKLEIVEMTPAEMHRLNLKDESGNNKFPEEYPLASVLENDPTGPLPGNRRANFPSNVALRFHPQTGQPESFYWEQYVKEFNAATQPGETTPAPAEVTAGSSWQPPATVSGQPATPEQTIYASNLSKFASLNGITTGTTLRLGDYTPVPGYIPQAQLVWHDANGNIVHTSGINVLMEGGDQAENNEIREVRRKLNLPDPDRLAVTWQKFLP